jgi:L-cysteine desulfidase
MYIDTPLLGIIFSVICFMVSFSVGWGVLLNKVLNMRKDVDMEVIERKSEQAKETKERKDTEDKIFEEIKQQAKENRDSHEKIYKGLNEVCLVIKGLETSMNNKRGN